MEVDNVLIPQRTIRFVLCKGVSLNLSWAKAYNLGVSMAHKFKLQARSAHIYWTRFCLLAGVVWTVEWESPTQNLQKTWPLNPPSLPWEEKWKDGSRISFTYIYIYISFLAQEFQTLEKCDQSLLNNYEKPKNKTNKIDYKYIKINK